VQKYKKAPADSRRSADLLSLYFPFVTILFTPMVPASWHGNILQLLSGPRLEAERSDGPVNLFFDNVGLARRAEPGRRGKAAQKKE